MSKWKNRVSWLCQQTLSRYLTCTAKVPIIRILYFINIWFVSYQTNFWTKMMSSRLLQAGGKKSLIMARKLACPVRFPIGTVLQPSKLSWGRGRRQSIGGAHWISMFSHDLKVILWYQVTESTWSFCLFRQRDRSVTVDSSKMAVLKLWHPQ
jgi:hypothetical protein